MGTTKNWAIVLSRLMRYLAYRAGFARKPTFMDIRDEATAAVGRLRRWESRTRVIEPERCPKSGPAVFAGNHCFTEDPFIMYYAIYRTVGIRCRFMMREGIFSTSRLFNCRLFDIDEFATLFGPILISREKVQLSQLKPFIKILREGESFIIYPTRTRTRTGAIIEFPEGFDEPGGVSFFLTQSQRGREGLRVAAVPVTRTDNFVSDRVNIVFGEPQYLEPDAGRDEQREFDYRLIRHIAEGVVVNVSQVLAMLLYLRCLHGLPRGVEMSTLFDQVAQVLKRVEGTHRIDADAGDVPGQVKKSLKWLGKAGMLRVRGSHIVLNREAILSSPAPDREYRRKNPVKYLVNQLLHFPDVAAAAEEVALSRMAPG